MTRDDIIGMAREVGFDKNSLGWTFTHGKLGESIEHFAALVAAAEREACAKLCEEEIEKIKPVYSVTTENALKAIRARGQ